MIESFTHKQCVFLTTFSTSSTGPVVTSSKTGTETRHVIESPLISLSYFFLTQVASLALAYYPKQLFSTRVTSAKWLQNKCWQPKNEQAFLLCPTFFCISPNLIICQFLPTSQFSHSRRARAIVCPLRRVKPTNASFWIAASHTRQCNTLRKTLSALFYIH